MLNVAAIFSTLGSSKSLIPLAVKDTFASIGMTTGSYITGKEEGQDRFIDEVGTEIIWLGGIPAYKWLFDNTIFKSFGLDSKFDARNIKNKKIFEKTKEYAPTKEIKKAIEKIDKNQETFKKLAASKFIVSTVLSILTYVGLTKLKQKYTEKQIEKHLIKEHHENNSNDSFETTNSQSSPSFKSLGSITENLAYNAVRNMWIMDGAITTERLLDSRSPQECFGYAIKEAYALCFLYYAGGKIQEMIENNALKKHNRNISLDSRILEKDYIKEVFDNKSIKESLDEFSKIKVLKDGKKDPVALYDFIFNNPDNALVKLAKQAKIIKMYKKTDKIDTRAFIDLDEVETLNKNVTQLYKQYLESLKQKGATTEKFFQGVKKLKRHSIITNIAVSVFALGVLAPATMLFKRKLFDKDTEFQTKKDIRDKLIKDGVIS